MLYIYISYLYLNTLTFIYILLIIVGHSVLDFHVPLCRANATVTPSYTSNWNASGLATHIGNPHVVAPTLLSHPRDCLPLGAERKSTTGSAQESSRCNSKPMTASPGRRARNAGGGEVQDSLGFTGGALKGAHVPSRRLEIMYIHARRLIKYSFAPSAARRVGQFFSSPSQLSLSHTHTHLVRSLSTPFLHGQFSLSLPSTFLSHSLSLSRATSSSCHTLRPLYSRA